MWCQTHNDLPSSIASLTISQYQIILLGNRGTRLWTTCPVIMQQLVSKTMNESNKKPKVWIGDIVFSLRYCKKPTDNGDNENRCNALEVDMVVYHSEARLSHLDNYPDHCSSLKLVYKNQYRGTWILYLCHTLSHLNNTNNKRSSRETRPKCM